MGAYIYTSLAIVGPSAPANMPTFQEILGTHANGEVQIVGGNLEEIRRWTIERLEAHPYWPCWWGAVVAKEKRRIERVHHFHLRGDGILAEFVFAIEKDLLTAFGEEAPQDQLPIDLMAEGT